MNPLTTLDKEQTQLFPPTHQALTDPNGLLAIGGDLQPSRLLAAYRLGIFPWPVDDIHLLWWSPNPRMVFIPGRMHLARSLQKRIARQDYQVSLNTQFTQVITLCAANRYRQDSWITDMMLKAYIQLHQLGYAHSVEIYQEQQLVGGLYGIALGGVFFGESMFHLQPDGAKLALYHLSVHLDNRGYQLIDCQVESPFLKQLGASTMSRETFEQQLARHIDLAIKFTE